MIRRGSVVDTPFPSPSSDGQAAPDSRSLHRLEQEDTLPPVPTDPSGRRSGRAFRVVGLAVVVALLTTAAAVVVVRSGASDGSDGSPADPATSTAEVTRQDLIARTEVDGTLGYSGDMSVMNQIPGTVTALPEPGAVVERGQTLYSVANRPVPLLYGDLPAWRRLAQDVDGADTLQLEQNLVAMGHATEAQMTVDGKFTAATTAALKRWQKAVGVDETGVVELGEAVFLPRALRVAEVEAKMGAGAPPGSPVLTGTSTDRVVKVDLDATRQSLVKVGDKVEIGLPDRRTTPGTVTEVGTVARTEGQGESARRVIAVIVTPDDPAATGSLDQAPVKVGITSDRREGVLTVPVNALLALAEGGYGVRVMDGTPSGRIVSVTTGLFSRGRVEVGGEGLVEGTRVEVPAS
ncbi:MAG TPA: peptidoglycan-binding domain-containing protein [Acidimicrobiales bacterium]|nr:peptidoglycan-binding domain-containing protein [Acidimicrobiales bacterium]